MAARRPLTACGNDWADAAGSRLFSLAAMAGCRTSPRSLPDVGPDGARPRRGHVPNWIFVHNHLHTVHAIASCNAAEIAMGMLMEATVPTSHRWIPKAMNVQYLQKATTSLRAQARLDPPDFAAITDGAELVVPVSVTDKATSRSSMPTSPAWVTPCT